MNRRLSKVAAAVAELPRATSGAEALAAAEALSAEVVALKETRIDPAEVRELRESVEAAQRWIATTEAKAKATVFESSLGSAILPELPAVLEGFRTQKFALLWRGSRDGFESESFHRNCDGHANTITVVLDTEGNVFGGFTPVEWEAREWSRDGTHCKADDSLTSFIFTLKNPHNFPAQRFALKGDAKNRAINCDAAKGPHFYDIGIADRCNENNDNYTHNFGLTYTNDTLLKGSSLFTGSANFRVQEIEVFEITDEVENLV
jgi:hypothetical protein